MKQISNQNRFYEYSESNELGSGAFAQVFKGVNKQTNTDVAIKVISRLKLKKYGEEIINAIGDEVNILQKLSFLSQKDPCPFIVKIFDCFQTTNNIYIILEYCNGGNLLDIIKKCPQGIPEQQAIKIFYQIVSGINYIAKHDIVHRDLKPENIFIHDGIYKIGDFGFASQKNMFYTTLGTYPYMAPEFFKDPSYDKLVDIWAVGIMYHEMLFNELYFMGNSQYEVSQKICNVPYKIVRTNMISPNSQDVLIKCIEKDRSVRITADQLINHPLFDPIKNDPQIQSLINQGGSSMSEQKQASPGVTQIFQTLINTRNGLLFLIRLSEKLEYQYLDQCRFDIYYLIRKCLNGITGLHLSLQNRQAPNFLKFKDPQDWVQFINSSVYTDIFTILDQDKLFITNKFFQYGTFLDLFIKQNFPQQYQQMQTIINLDLNQIIQPQLYSSQIKNLFDYFTNQYHQLKNQEDLFLASMLAIAFKIDNCITNQTINFEKFEIESSQYTLQDLMNIINQAISS
ncbi:hypothetical protein ABPG73_015563 [Tetrahymena malaccensis]